MKKRAMTFTGGFALACITAIFMAAAPANKNPVSIGVTNFKICLEGSKMGKKEQGRFDEMKKQMEAAIEVKEKELNELAPKFKDEYLDTLTPEAEVELKEKFRVLSQELSQSQNQYYQLLNQAHYQVVQKMTEEITKAAKKVADTKGLDFVLNEEACFYAGPSYDVSADVIKVLDANFAENEAAKNEQEKNQEKK